MDRRTLLKLFGIGALGTSFGAYFASRVAASEGQTIHWEYSGEEGPEHWGELSSEFEACQLGTTQSPIDLNASIEADLDALQLNYNDTPLKVLNNGHTIQVEYAPGSSMTLDEEVFELAQFHFHHPSEHTATGDSFPMELHLVHRHATGALSVIGVFLKEGRPNAALQPIWDALPTTSGTSQNQPNVRINAAALLPEQKQFYRYFGSLTTPPCSEGVNWIVMQQPIEVSREQIAQFAALFPSNARPIQNRNHRFLLRSS